MQRMGANTPRTPLLATLIWRLDACCAKGKATGVSLQMPPHRSSLPMNTSRKHTIASRIVATAAIAAFLLAAVQVATSWPFAARMTGPALLALSIHGALVLAFLAGDLWRSAASEDSAAHDLRRAMAILAALAGWAGIWLGARDGLLVLAAGHLLLAVYWLGAGGRAGHGPFGSLVALFCLVNTLALVAAALLGPFV